VAYTFQLYFDFSGYSDMAIGISLMFGIFLPSISTRPTRPPHHRFLAALAYDAIGIVRDYSISRSEITGAAPSSVTST
jgi:hypothetical protein